MNTETRKFHLGHILSITTDVLCPVPGNEDYPMRTVREILNYMSNEDGIQTFSLPRVAEECKPYLLEQFPQLADITAAHLTYGDFEANFKRLVKQYGEWFEVRPIHPEDHQVIDPQVEFAMMKPDVEMFTINIDEDGDENDE